MPPDNELSSKEFTLYITSEDGARTKIGYMNSQDVSMKIKNTKDITACNFGKYDYSGSFSFKSFNKNLFRLFTDKSYIKYLKRIRNRQKLYSKLKKKGRKL